MKVVIWLVMAVVLLGVWWRFFRVARPAFPPLAIDENDPLMKEAVQQAKHSIPEFRELYRQRPQHANDGLHLCLLLTLYAKLQSISVSSILAERGAPSSEHRERVPSEAREIGYQWSKLQLVFIT